MSRAASAKSERVNLRLDAAAKRRLERAASVEGKTVSGFILSSALARAEETIQNHETMALSRRDAETFLDAVLMPPKPSTKLSKALADLLWRARAKAKRASVIVGAGVRTLGGAVVCAHALSLPYSSATPNVEW